MSYQMAHESGAMQLQSAIKTELSMLLEPY